MAKHSLSIHNIDEWFESFQKDFPLEPKQSTIEPFAWLDCSAEALAELDNRKAKHEHKVARARDNALSKLLADNGISTAKIEAEIEDMLDYQSAVMALWS